MATRIPIKDLKQLAKAHKLSHAVLLAYSPHEGVSHVVTYGNTGEQCSQAADVGNRLKKQLEWPESLQAQPSRVRRLEKELAELRAIKGVLPETLTPPEQQALAILRQIIAGETEQERVDLPDGRTVSLTLEEMADVVPDDGEDRDPREGTE